MSVLDLSENIAEFATGTYAVTRASVGSYTNGIWVPGVSPSTVQVLGMVCPMSGRELQRLEEGLRSKETKGIYTQVKLQVSAPGQRPDVISIDGESWQVEKVDDWGPLGNFYYAVVSKMPTEENP